MGTSLVFCAVLGFICWMIYLCRGRYGDGLSDPLRGRKDSTVSSRRDSEDEIEREGLKKVIGVHL